MWVVVGAVKVYLQLLLLLLLLLWLLLLLLLWLLKLLVVHRVVMMHRQREGGGRNAACRWDFDVVLFIRVTSGAHSRHRSLIALLGMTVLVLVSTAAAADCWYRFLFVLLWLVLIWNILLTFSTKRRSGSQLVGSHSSILLQLTLLDPPLL